MGHEIMVSVMLTVHSDKTLLCLLVREQIRNSSQSILAIEADPVNSRGILPMSTWTGPVSSEQTGMLREAEYLSAGASFPITNPFGWSYPEAVCGLAHARWKAEEVGEAWVLPGQQRGSRRL